ncbi:aminotransferase class V-fold PLP-dependent enzyme [Desertibaculum subflavum]|uniref:aminotransferase class V-fold PLP-dependent enzyme n=1 Tax=Desertibaculum subflavum TaxID=2268458 RepID=UPI000E66F527
MIPSQRHLFDIPDDIAYLNCAYMGPLPRAAREAGEEAAGRKARAWEITPRDFFTETETARDLFAALIGATAEDIAIVPAASYGVAVAAANLRLPPGRRALVLAHQFPSNLFSWQDLAEREGGEVVTVARPEDGDWTRSILQAIDERTAIAALPNCHWTDGGLIDLVRVGARLREVGAALVIDATQSLGALPIDMRAVQPDFLVAATYKWLLGPYSYGFLYVAPGRQDGRPIEQNWIARGGSEDFARLVDYRADFQPGARRFDVGEKANFGLTPVAIASLRQIHDWGVAEIQATLRRRTDAIAARAHNLGLTAARASLRAGHFLGLRFPGAVPEGLPEKLAQARVYVSVRGPAMRITPHLYNTDADIDRLFEVLGAVL